MHPQDSRASSPFRLHVERCEPRLMLSTVVSGSEIRVATETALQEAVANLQSGETILIEPGTYNLTRTLYIPQQLENIAIRGSTGNRDAVVLVGQGMNNQSSNTPFGIWADNVIGIEIADLTI